MLKGNELIPTADLAPLPASPKTSIIKLEKPSMTFGCSENPGAEFTIPKVRIIRSTLSNDPNSSFKADKVYKPTLRAAAIASSRLQIVGTWPVIGEPSEFLGP